MQTEGTLYKMRTEQLNPVEYFLPIGNSELFMNEMIGLEMEIHFKGVINCIYCGAKTRKSYNQGYCYNCLTTRPEADESVIRPELSKSHLGVSRDMKWAEENDLIDHYVYLSVTSNLKVGVTRYYNIPSRWIDQGASFALPIAKTPNRHIAGIIEIFLKKFVPDKTNWIKMLQSRNEPYTELEPEKQRLCSLLPKELQQYIIHEEQITSIIYPGNIPNEKINNIHLETQNNINGRLIGIKGQYLLFDSGEVLNIRSHAGYHVEIISKN
jgi:hypothetical protein